MAASSGTVLVFDLTTQSGWCKLDKYREGECIRSALMTIEQLMQTVDMRSQVTIQAKLGGRTKTISPLVLFDACRRLKRGESSELVWTRLDRPFNLADFLG